MRPIWDRVNEDQGSGKGPHPTLTWKVSATKIQGRLAWEPSPWNNEEAFWDVLKTGKTSR